MFSGQRDFRTIILSSSLSEVREVLSLFPKNTIAKEVTEVQGSERSFQVHHAFYYSETAYAPPETITDILVPVGRYTKYKYDFYIAKWQPKRKAHFVLAVPFTKMAEDMFGTLDALTVNHSRNYKCLNLRGLIDALAEESSAAKDITANSIRFLVGGGDSVKSVEFSGGDVVSSQLYRRTTSSLKGIKLLPRRVRLIFNDGAVRLSLEADGHGSYWIRVRKGGTNLPWLYHVLSAFEEGGLWKKDDLGYPLREGILQQEREELLQE